MLRFLGTLSLYLKSGCCVFGFTKPSEDRVCLCAGKWGAGGGEGRGGPGVSQANSLVTTYDTCFLFRLYPVETLRLKS